MSNQAKNNIHSRWNNIKADSLMISYVLLISMALILGIGVYGWLNFETPTSVQIVDCGEDTSLSIESYQCTPGDFGGIKLIIKNNGRFNIDGFVLTASNDTNKTPIFKLLPKSKNLIKSMGYVDFEAPLTPGKEKEIDFDNIYLKDRLDSLVSLKIQPFTYGENKKDRLLCKETKITETVEDCIIGKNPPGYEPANKAPLPPTLSYGYILPSCVQKDIPFTIKVDYSDPNNTLTGINDLNKVYLALRSSSLPGEPKLYETNPALIVYKITGGSKFGVVDNENLESIIQCNEALFHVWNDNIKLSCSPTETYADVLKREGENSVKMPVTYTLTITNIASISGEQDVYALAYDLHNLNSGWVKLGTLNPIRDLSNPCT
jgi:hypothetical protein